MSSTSAETRPVESLISESRLWVATVRATHSRPGPSVGPSRMLAARSHQATSTPAPASGGASSHPFSHAVRVEPARSSAFSRSASTIASLPGRPTRDLLAKGVEGGELLAHRCLTGELEERRRATALNVSCNASTARVAADAGLLSSWRSPAAIVPETDELLALSRHGVHSAHGLEEALDEMHAEREPSAGEVTERPRGHPEHPPRADAPGGGEVAAALVPRLEATSPLTGGVHRHHDHGRFAAREPHEVDLSLQQHPPAVRRVALFEDLLALDERVLLTDLEELAELLVGRARRRGTPCAARTMSITSSPGSDARDAPPSLPRRRRTRRASSSRGARHPRRTRRECSSPG